MTEPLRIEWDGSLAVLTIDHPPLNFWGKELWSALPGAIRSVAAMTPRALLIRAEGKVFTAGVHVENFRDIDRDEAHRLWQEQIAMIHDLEALPCPTIFAAHALTLTAGFELALGCDIIVAAKSASFGLVERRVGLTPANGGVQRLVALAGANRARDLVFSGDIFSAQTMLEWGVVTRVYDDAGFDQAARDFAQDLASGPTLGYAAVKELVRACERGGVAEADRIMPEIAADLWRTQDFGTAIAGFLEHGPRHASRFDGR